jgi:hypothetical protein
VSETEPYTPVVDGTCAACGMDIAAGAPARRAVPTGDTYHDECVPSRGV